MTATHSPLIRLLCTFWVCVFMSACTGVVPLQPAASTVQQDIDWVALSPAATGGSIKWENCTFPGKKPTSYNAISVDGRHAVKSESRSAASMLRQSLRVEPAAMGRLRFSWRVPELIHGADLTQRDTDDSPVRVVLAFEGDRSKFSAKNAMLSELALALTGEALPYATLMRSEERRVGKECRL